MGSANYMLDLPCSIEPRLLQSQLGQDRFVAMALEDKRGGTFVDIGAGEPWRLSNTVALQYGLDWSGVLCDIEWAAELAKQRKPCMVFSDAFNVKWREVFEALAVDGRIDFLSLDLEPPELTEKMLDLLPLDAVRFSVACIEHDDYRGPRGKERRDRMRKRMRDSGYAHVACVEQDDWWVDSSVVDLLRIDRIFRETEHRYGSARERPRIPPPNEQPFHWQMLCEYVGDAETIIEIGAHQGTDTMVMMHHFPRAKIHCFEPDPRAAAIHAESIADPRISLHRLAIGASDGIADFHQSDGTNPTLPAHELEWYPEGWDQSGSLRRPTCHMGAYPWCKFHDPIKVETRSLDSWAGEHKIGNIDLIWADMQGSEGDLVLAGKQTLARTRLLFLEYSDIELYEGEPTLSQIMDMLPDWYIVWRSLSDVLLRNRKM